jgi:dihydrofolate reductase
MIAVAWNSGAGLSWEWTSRENRMRKLLVFNHVTLDGYFADANGGMSWAKTDNSDREWNAFVEQNASDGGVLVFGRITYQRWRAFGQRRLQSR